jgi:Na+/H+-dicarboxylate symporter
MKNWLTYLISSALGIFFYFMFHSQSWYSPVVLTAVNWLQAFCYFGFIVVMGLSLSAAVSSFFGHRDIGSRVLLTNLLWGLVSGFVLCAVSGALFLVLPRTAADTAQASASAIVFPNRFFIVFVAALIIGFALRPTSKIFKEAYGLSNSLSEAAFRFCKDFSRFWWVALFFFAANSAAEIQNYSFTVLVPSLVIAGASVLVVLPLLFCIFTGFKVNPYRKMFRLLPPALSSLFGQSFESAFIPLYCSERNNLGIQKRIAAVSIPVSRIAGRGGSAAFATYAICLGLAGSGESVGLRTILLVAAACTCASFVACAVPGSAILAVCAVAFQILGKNPTAVVLLPLLIPLSAMTDVLIAGLCSVVIGKNYKADCEICYWDTI